MPPVPRRVAERYLAAYRSTSRIYVLTKVGDIFHDGISRIFPFWRACTIYIGLHISFLHSSEKHFDRRGACVARITVLYANISRCGYNAGLLLRGKIKKILRMRVSTKKTIEYKSIAQFMLRLDNVYRNCQRINRTKFMSATLTFLRLCC